MHGYRSIAMHGYRSIAMHGYRSIAVVALVSLTLGSSGGAGAATTQAAVKRAAKSAKSTTSAKPKPSAKPGPKMTNDPYLGPLRFSWPKAACDVTMQETVKKTTREGTKEPVNSTAAAEWLLQIRPDSTKTLLTMNIVSSSTGGKVETIPPTPIGTIIFDRSGTLLASKLLASALDEDFEPWMARAADLAIESKYWRPWVALWNEMESIDEVAMSLTYPVATGAQPIDVPVTVVSEGPRPVGRARLRVTEKLEGKAFAAVVRGAMAELANVEVPAWQGSRLSVYEIDTDPKTMRPDRGVSQVEISLEADGKGGTRTDIRSWTMDWAGSNCR